MQERIQLYETIRIHFSLKTTHITTRETLEKVLDEVLKQYLKRIPFLIISQRTPYTHYILFIGEEMEYKGFDIIKSTDSCAEIENIRISCCDVLV